VTKIYTDSQKYNRVNESFNFKLAIFKDIYKKASLQPDSYMIVFPTILKGLVQDYYYNCTLLTRIYLKAYTYIQNFFKGPEFYRKNFIKWNTITLQGIINANTNKPIY